VLRQDTAACLTAAVKSIIGLIKDGNDTVVVAAYGQSKTLLVGHDYWVTDGECHAVTFEHRVAREALAAQENFGALVVPVLYRQDDSGPFFRDPHNTMIAGETPTLFCITWHEREGFDVHRVFYTRRPNGEPVFASLESLAGAVQLPESAPGAVLVRSAIHHGGSS